MKHLVKPGAVSFEVKSLGERRLTFRVKVVQYIKVVSFWKRGWRGEVDWNKCHQTYRANFIKPLDTWFKVEPGHNLKIDQVSKLGQFH